MIEVMAGALRVAGSTRHLRATNGGMRPIRLPAIVTMSMESPHDHQHVEADGVALERIGENDLQDRDRNAEGESDEEVLAQGKP